MSCYDYALAGGDPWLMLQSSAGDFAEHPLKAIEALQGYHAGVMFGTRTVTVRNAVAVINVIGPILRYANSRYVSTEVIALDFRAALDNPAIKAIVLNVDSPGGQAAGINELAEIIYAARSKKKVVAYVGGVAASAAYWIASSASEVVVDATALVGSIGVAVTAASSPRSVIVSRNAPNKRPDIATEQGRAKVAETIDALAAVFTAKVARNLGVKPDRVMAMGDRGGIKVGAAAVRAGLAHRLGSFESLVASLNSGWQNKPNASATASTLVGAAPSGAKPAPTVQQISADALPLDEQAPPTPSITTENIWRQRNARHR